MDRCRCRTCQFPMKVGENLRLFPISCSSLIVLYQVFDCWQPDCNIAAHYEHDYDLMQAS
jgi:hypothetical protein